MGHAHYCSNVPLAQVCGSVLQGYLLPLSCLLVLQQKEFLMRLKKSQAVLKNSKNDDKPKGNALRLNRKVIEEAGCVSA